MFIQNASIFIDIFNGFHLAVQIHASVHTDLGHGVEAIESLKKGIIKII